MQTVSFRDRSAARARRRWCAVLSVAFAASPRLAYADGASPDGASPAAGPSASYLWDGGALALFWGALGAQVAIATWGSPRATPLWFDPAEGGAPRSSWEVPNWTLTLTGVGVGVAMVAGDDDARWYHAKGLAEALAFGGLVTGVVKKSFGRHRPDWSATSTDAGRDESFPSGHATEAFAIATYAALYLRYHAFARWRPAGSLAWWEAAAYAGLFTGAAVLAGERVYHHRHYLSDVTVGALLGTAEAAAAYCYQDHRFHRRAPSVVPVVTPEAATVQLRWKF